MRKVRRQDRSIFLLVAAIMMLNTTGVRAFVTPPPRLPQPAAVALAAPTTFFENCWEHHTWQHTKVARPQKMIATATEAIFPFPMSNAVRERVSSRFRYAASGAGANVEKKVAKKPIQLAWKHRMCGSAKLQICSSVALCSASTAQRNGFP